MTGLTIISPAELVKANQDLFIAEEFKFQDFPRVYQTKAGWLIGTYDDLRSFVESMKEDNGVRDGVWVDLQQRKQHLEGTTRDGKQKLLIRCGRRDSDNFCDAQGSLDVFQDKTGPKQAKKIDHKIDTKALQRAIAEQGIAPHASREQVVPQGQFDKKLNARVMDIDPSGDYYAHWSQRQFEVHHIVEDSLAAMTEAKARISDLTRGNSLCVLVCAELHQRFFTSALATKRETQDGQMLSERNRLNLAKTREAFKRTYAELYADPAFQELGKLANWIIYKSLLT